MVYANFFLFGKVIAEAEVIKAQDRLAHSTPEKEMG